MTGFDLEWSQRGIDVLGLAEWRNGRVTTMSTAADPYTMERFMRRLRESNRIVGHNIIDADLPMLAKEGYDTNSLLHHAFDTRLALHATHGHLAGSGSYDLRSMALLLGEWKGERYPLDFKDYEGDLYRTCAMDAGAALWCGTILESLVSRYKLEKTVAIAHQCAPIFRRMQDQGVRLDSAVLEQIYVGRKARVAEIVERYQLWEERGKKVVKRVPIWRSPKLLDRYEGLFGKRPADLKRETWQKLAKQQGEAGEFAAAIVELTKGANDAHWLGKAEEGEDGVSFEKVSDDGFIFPRYDICGSPDRAVASGPNIQNFPRPREDPRSVPLRRAVVPLYSDHAILGVDFSSVETITNAYESKDMDRVRAVLTKRITHEGTAERMGKVLGLALNRQQGKAINHAFDKGESPFNLAARLFNVQRPSPKQTQLCREVYNAMLAEWPQTSKFRDELWERAQANPLVVTNAFGRRLLCFSRSKYGDGPSYAKHNPSKKYWCSCSSCAPKRDRWKYAISFLGRSSAFDALLRAMARIWQERVLDEFSLPYLECHDELDWSVPANRVVEYADRAKAVMSAPIPELDGIALPSEAKWGASWAESH